MIEQFANWLVEIVHGVGYLGLFITMFLGNACVPIPIEFTMIPAGYLVHQGQMNLWVLLATSIAGDISGSLFAYYIAAHVGRRFFYAYGKYILLTPERISMVERFFASHGHVSVLTGRLVPGLRHFMAFPAGLAHMDVKKFVLYTGVGGGLWLATLIAVGYIIGGEKRLIRHYMPYITGAVVVGVVVMVAVYTIRHRRKMKGNSHGMA